MIILIMITIMIMIMMIIIIIIIIISSSITIIMIIIIMQPQPARTHLVLTVMNSTTDHARAPRAALREVRDDGVAAERARCFPPKAAGMKRQVTC
jgi:hypothetical protein